MTPSGDAPTESPPDFWSGLKRKQTLLDLAAFALSLVLAFVFRWRADDLVWSLWLSSLALGCVMYVAWLAPTAWNDTPSWASATPLYKRIIAPVSTLTRLVLPLTLLFVIFYVGAHLAYSIFLNHSLPVIPEQGDPSWAMYREILRNYWVFLPITFFREHRAFLSLFRRNESDDDVQISFWLDRGKTLIKTHILIFVLVLLPLGNSDSFLTYAAVSAVYFFPWEIFVKPSGKNKTSWADAIALAKKKTAEEMARQEREKQKNTERAARKKRKR